MINPFINRDTPILVDGFVGNNNLVTEATYGKGFQVWSAAPCAWSRDRGATHTLLVENDHAGGGTRPARLLKTVMYVGIDEVDNDIVWEKWRILRRGGWTCWPTCRYTAVLSPHHAAMAARGTIITVTAPESEPQINIR